MEKIKGKMQYRFLYLSRNIKFLQIRSLTPIIDLMKIALLPKSKIHVIWKWRNGQRHTLQAKPQKYSQWMKTVLNKIKITQMLTLKILSDWTKFLVCRRAHKCREELKSVVNNGYSPNMRAYQWVFWSGPSKGEFREKHWPNELPEKMNLWIQNLTSSMIRNILHRMRYLSMIKLSVHRRSKSRRTLPNNSRKILKFSLVNNHNKLKPTVWALWIARMSSVLAQQILIWKMIVLFKGSTWMSQQWNDLSMLRLMGANMMWKVLQLSDLLLQRVGKMKRELTQYMIYLLKKLQMKLKRAKNQI